MRLKDCLFVVTYKENGTTQTYGGYDTYGAANEDALKLKAEGKQDVKIFKNPWAL